MTVRSIRVLSVLFILTAVPARVGAQLFVCYPIRPGDTAAQIALRLTGSADRRHDLRFRIVDPKSSTIIPKGRYDSVRPGWLACLAAAPATRLKSDRPAYVQASPAMPPVSKEAAGIVLARVAWWAGFGFLIALLGWFLLERASQKTQATIARMKHFGDRFIREFERPLAQDGRSERPIKARLRCMPRRERLDILIAPGAGRRYPNLSDHRTNVEYDIERIAQLLRDQTFVGGEPYAQGSWVVIPFELKPDTRTEGAP
jgi:hypothetical protein